MTNQLTSRVVPTMRALLELCRATPWTPGDGVDEMHIGVGWPTVPTGEHCVIVPSILIPAVQRQETMGPGNRFEAFGLVVNIASYSSLFDDALDALERVDQLQSALEARLRSYKPGLPNNRHARPDVDGVVWWEAGTSKPFALINPQGGWWAESELVINVRCHI